MWQILFKLSFILLLIQKISFARRSIFCQTCIHFSTVRIVIWPKVSFVKRKHIDPCLGQPAETELAVAVDRGEDDAGREEAGEDAGGGQEGVRGRGQEAAAAHVPGPEAAKVLGL